MRTIVRCPVDIGPGILTETGGLDVHFPACHCACCQFNVVNRIFGWAPVEHVDPSYLQNNTVKHWGKHFNSLAMIGIKPVKGLQLNNSLVGRHIDDLISGWLISGTGNICGGTRLLCAVPDHLVLMPRYLVRCEYHRFDGNTSLSLLFYISSRSSISCRLGARNNVNHRLDLATLHRD